MCANCNSTRSQPFDRAYDRFVSFLTENECEILQTRRFAWSDIFGPAWTQGQVDTARYWLKHIGTRLASDGRPVPAGIVSFLDGNYSSPKHFALRLEVRLDIAEFENHLRKVHGGGAGTLWIGGLSATRGRKPVYLSHWGWRWLRLEYQAGLRIRRAETNFATEVVELPSDYVFDPVKITDMCRACAG